MTLSEIFGSLERLLGELYPYRFALAALAFFLMSAAGLALHRTGFTRAAGNWARLHPGASVALVVAVLAVAIPLGNYTLSPLWTRSSLEEPSPILVRSEPRSAIQAPEPAPAVEPAASGGNSEVRVLREGRLAGADSFHFGRGNALLLDVGNGPRVLRLEELAVRNGPDLFVYLSNSTNSVVDAVNLGALKATDGSFNYEVPAAVEGAGLDYALIWCRQFGVLFASAPLAIVP